MRSDKIRRLLLAATVAASISPTTPSLALEISAEQFVSSFAGHIQSMDLTGARIALNDLQAVGIDAVVIGGRTFSIAELFAMLDSIEAGQMSPEETAASLATLAAASTGFFVADGARLAIIDIPTAAPPQFPAGSAG